MMAGWALVLAVALSSVASAASVDRAPRLWRVTGEGDAGAPVVFFLLGVTHNGLPAEYDAYFRSRVIPAFGTANHYSYENASLTGAKTGPCARPLVSDHGRAAVEALRARLVDITTRFYEAVDRRVFHGRSSRTNPWRQIAQADVNGMSEFDMLLDLQSKRAALSSLDGRAPAQEGASSREQVATTLAKTRPDILAAPLDVPQDLIDAYCDSGEGRVAFIDGALDRDDLLAQPTRAATKAIGRELELADRDFDATFHERRPIGIFDAGRQFNESIACERNAKWVVRMTHPDASGPWFYAVGLTHLFPIAGATASCAGLLDDLRHAGWSVTPVTAKT